MIALVVLAPIVAVLSIALFPTDNIWPHLISTTLPRYLRNTLILMGSDGLLTANMGSGTGWVIVRYRFPMSRWLEWM